MKLFVLFVIYKFNMNRYNRPQLINQVLGIPSFSVTREYVCGFSSCGDVLPNRAPNLHDCDDRDRPSL